MSFLLEKCHCGSSNGRNFFYNDLPITECFPCMSLRQNVSLTKEEYFKFYSNGYYKDREESRHKEELVAAQKRLDEYGDLLHGKILDIGSGLGGFIETMQAHNKDCWGQDIVYHKTLIQNSIYIGELESIHFPTDGFDIITIHDVLEHIIDIKSFLKEVFRITKQTGYVIIDFPDFFSDDGRHHWRLTEHLWMLREDVLCKIFKEIGFNINKMWNPIPGKFTFELQKPKQERIKILLPPGIGDVYWVLTKLESFCKINDIYIPEVRIMERGPRNRSLDFVQSFPFLHAGDYCAEKGNPKQWAEVYKQDGETIFKNVMGCDYFIAFNGPMRFGRTLEEIHPEYKVNWYPPMFSSMEEKLYGVKFLNQYGPFVIGYLSGYRMYKHWLSEFGIRKIEETFRIINKQTGRKIVLVGSEWDLNGPAKELHDLNPDIFIDIVGKTNIKQLLGLFQQCDGILGYPSGITIWAVAKKVPTLMLWNSYFDKRFWRNACSPDSFGKWYEVSDTKDLETVLLANKFINMIGRKDA